MAAEAEAQGKAAPLSLTWPRTAHSTTAVCPPPEPRPALPRAPSLNSAIMAHTIVRSERSRSDATTEHRGRRCAPRRRSAQLGRLREISPCVLVLELAVQDVDGRFHLPALPRRLGGGLALWRRTDIGLCRLRSRCRVPELKFQGILPFDTTCAAPRPECVCHSYSPAQYLLCCTPGVSMMALMRPLFYEGWQGGRQTLPPCSAGPPGGGGGSC
jgi:hypothetical protein